MGILDAYIVRISGHTVYVKYRGKISFLRTRIVFKGDSIL